VSMLRGRMIITADEHVAYLARGNEHVA
jgi:hypothetical protein